MANFDDLLTSIPTEEPAPQLSKEEYAAKKKAEREEVFAQSDQTALEVAGDGGKFAQFLDLQARLDRYSAVNALLTFAKDPGASRLGSFDYWKRQNCSVKPGQTAIAILEPQEYTKDDGTPGMGYAVRKVFDISQVDTRKLRNAPPHHYTERQILGALISKYPMKIIGVDDLPDNLGAMTSPDGDILVRKGMEFSDTFRAVAYEMAGAELATDPQLSPEQEFCAYSATYLLCRKYGVETREFNFDKVGGVFDGMDAQEIKGELAQIRDAAENISGRMERQLEAQQRTAKNQNVR
ncbi:hypothetical protein [Caproiciproducens sp. CPB-2]|uniref:hypothetical protein n=1 Tax=Caproiciproducens sp. CPB-2 TaxID=3030017 RepID=UPI0023DB33EE|nr:hypothetical protein [Caproiciproducens sp. CPB-2]MDF1494556.1 hypothetical protein [Caproiciproducens sp. CPB-2]